jgi:hypothetical protein
LMEGTTHDLKDPDGHVMGRVSNGVLVIRNGKRMGAWSISSLLKMVSSSVVDKFVHNEVESR